MVREPTETQLILFRRHVIDLCHDSVPSGRIRTRKRERSRWKIRRWNHVQDLHRNRVKPLWVDEGIGECLACERINRLLRVRAEISIALRLCWRKRRGSRRCLMNQEALIFEEEK